MRSKIILLISVLLFITINVYSQKCDWTEISLANQKYAEGNFDEAIKMAQNCSKTKLDDFQRIEIYRLLAKAYLATDQDSAAIVVTKNILLLNQKFEPNYLTDPPKFIEIIGAIKKMSQQQVITSISKKEENILEAPALAIVITDEEIKNRGYLDFEAVLHDLSGFDISRSNGNLYTHVYQRGYRSINTNRTLFLIDGVEDNDLWSSNVYLSRQFIMSNLKSLEVIYGPASTMYGSNAFLGVINIKSKDPQDIIAPNKIFGANINAGYGSYNTKFIDGTLAIQTRDHNIGFMFSARTFFSDEQNLSRYSTHDYEPIELTPELAEKYKDKMAITDSTKIVDFLSQNPTSSELYFSDENGVYLTDKGVEKALEYDNWVLNNVTFSDKTETMAFSAKLKIYDFKFGWYYWKKAEGPGSQYNDLRYLGFDKGQQWEPIHNYFYIDYSKDINNKLQITNFLTYKTHYLGNNNRIVTYGKNYLSGNYKLQDLINDKIPKWDTSYLFYKSSQVRNETKILYQPTSRINLLAGIELRFSDIQGDYYTSKTNNAEQSGFPLTEIPGGNMFYSQDYGFYIQTDIKIWSNLKLTLGERYDYNLVRLDEGYGSTFNHRVALVFMPKTYVFKAIYATAFKDATNREKYSTAAGKRELPNPELQPEKVQNIEFSVGKKFANNGYFNISYYYSTYSNIIQEVSVLREDSTRTNQNQAIGKAEIQGINSFINLKFKKINIWANYTMTLPYAIDPVNSIAEPLLDSLGNPFSKLRISDIATHRANLGIDYNLFKNFNFDIRLNFVGKRITGVETTVPTNIEIFNPYILLNSTLTYKIPKVGIVFQVSGFNLLNTEYFEPGLDAASGVLSSKLAQNKMNIYFNINYIF